jgi:segregation and condensation protein A
MSLTDRINELVDLLRVRKKLTFDDLFADLASRFDLVITFLALLEMTRLRMTRLFQSEPNAPIHVEFTAQTEEESTTSSASETSEIPETPETKVEP